MHRIRDIRLLYVAAVLALVAASAAVAQDWAGRGRARGQVTGPDGEPLEGVKVQLLKDGVEGQGPGPVYTDKKGRWSYLGLAGGDWTILLDYEGMMPSQGSVHVSEFGAGQNVKVQLREIPEEVLEEAAADERRKLIDQGNALLAEGKFAEARAAYEEVMAEIDESQHPALLRGVARTHYQEGDVDQAIAALERALQVVPDDVETLRLAISLLVASNREADAQVYMDRLPEGSGVDPNALLNLGIQRYNENDLDKALEYFNRAADENPDMADVFYYRGLTYLNQGHNAKSVADFKKVLEIAPGYEKADEVRQFIEYLDSQSQE